MTDDTQKIESMTLEELAQESQKLSPQIDELIADGDQIRAELNETLTKYDKSLEDFRIEVEEITNE